MVCARCEMTAVVGPGSESSDPPPGWSLEGTSVYCIDCSRERAAETARAEMPLDADWEALEHAAAQARIRFELELDPDRSDKQIARVCRASILGVRNARKRQRGRGSDPLLDPLLAEPEHRQPT
jgi:hypothetical protein